MNVEIKTHMVMVTGGRSNRGICIMYVFSNVKNWICSMENSISRKSIENISQYNNGAY